MGSLLSHPSISIKIVCTHRLENVSLSASLNKIKLQVTVRIRQSTHIYTVECRMSSLSILYCPCFHDLFWMIELPSQHKLQMTSDTFERFENNANRPLAQALICDSADDDLCESLIAGIVTRCRLECDPDQPIRGQYLAELTNQSPAKIPGVTYLMRDTFLVFSPRPLSWPRSLTRSVWDNFRESAQESKLVRNDALNIANLSSQ